MSPKGTAPAKATRTAGGFSNSWRLALTEAVRRLLVRRGSFVVEFHGVTKKRYPEAPSHAVSYLTADELRAILRWLGERFRFLTPKELLAPGGPPEAGVLLTFDDGLANNPANALPVLEEFNAPAIFFVATRHVRNPSSWLPSARLQAQECGDFTSEAAADLFDGMSREELLRCGQHALVTIGGHTEDHPRLTTCDDETLKRELGTSKDFLEQTVGSAVEFFAYPYGDYDLRVARAVEEAGYRAAFVEDPRPVGRARFEIPRVGLYRARHDYLSAKLCGLHRSPLRPGFLAGSHPNE